MEPGNPRMVVGAVVLSAGWQPEPERSGGRREKSSQETTRGQRVGMFVVSIQGKLVLGSFSL